MKTKYNQAKQNSTTRFKLKEGVLTIKIGENYKICIPESTIDLLIDETHEMYAHIGARKCYKMLSENFYFPKLAKHIRKRLASCDSCQRNKYTNKKETTEMQFITASKPNEALSLDFYGPLPAPRGASNTYYPR